MNEEEIRNNIKEFIRSESPYTYYVGIAKEPKVRLQAHSALHAKALSMQADSIEIARRVERYFVDVINTDGGTGGGDDDSTYVYCYKKDDLTIQKT